MQVNIKKSVGTKKAETMAKFKRIEDQMINKIDKYKSRKELRQQRRLER